MQYYSITVPGAIKKGRMNVKKWITAIALLMVLSLLGCGAQTSPSRSIEAPAGDAGKAQDAQAQEQQPAAEAQDAEAQEQQPAAEAQDAEAAVALCTLFNESVPSGTLPVNVPRITLNDGVVTFEDELLYERGAGLELWGD